MNIIKRKPKRATRKVMSVEVTLPTDVVGDIITDLSKTLASNHVLAICVEVDLDDQTAKVGIPYWRSYDAVRVNFADVTEREVW